VAFFHGDGVRHTYRAFVRMLAQDGAALLELACASPNGSRYLDPDAMRARLARLRRDPEPGAVETLLRLVNLGLLDAMAADPPPPPAATRSGSVPAVLAIGDWAAERERIELLTLPPPVGPDRVLRLGEGVELAYPDPATCYLIVEGSVEYIVSEQDDPAWLRFLRAVDGRREVAKLLAETGDDYAAVRETLDYSVDHGLLVPAPEAAAPQAGPLEAGAPRAGAPQAVRLEAGSPEAGAPQAVPAGERDG